MTKNTWSFIPPPLNHKADNVAVAVISDRHMIVPAHDMRVLVALRECLDLAIEERKQLDRQAVRVCRKVA